jgi:nucleoside triphosphate pyrophosphatase
MPGLRLVLASASPRRAELLTAAGFTFEVLAVDLDERARPGEAPADYVSRLAAEKTARVLELLDEAAEEKPRAREAEGPNEMGVRLRASEVVILGADTAVVVGGEILGKPAHDGDAARMLRLLSGRAHDVMTGISLRSPAGEVSGIETTTVWFAPLSPDEIAAYVARGEGRDKAGAYAIQGFAARFIPRIEGSYSNVVGLPIARVSEALKRAAVDVASWR